ncbi:ArsR/SmtB family transcription factor [Stappia sp. ICDLI1TA098]|jgi:ArsR family transcriptional regulator
MAETGDAQHDEAGDDSEVAIAALGRALAHPARVRIVRLLLERGPLIGADLVAALGLAQSTVSEHLRILREGGLVGGRSMRPRVAYSLNPEALGPLADLLLEILEEAPADAVD